MKKMLGLFAVFSITLFLSASVATAAIIQVSPGQDLQAALDATVDGDIIQMAEGTYTGQGFAYETAITIEGGWSSDFTERDITAHPTVLQVTGWGIFTMREDSIIDGLTVIGAGVGNGIENCGTDFIVRNCTVRNFDIGIQTCSITLNVIENCVADNNGTGIAVCGPSSTYNCLIINNGVGIGICCGSRVVNCTIADNDTAIDDCEELYITNSIIWNNTNLSVRSCDPGSVLAGNWITNSDVQDPNLAGANENICADPLFNADYTLGSGSPCIDAGAETMLQYGNPLYATITDLPLAFNGAAPDMGAYETEDTIAAQVNISANTINVKSKGNYITCYIELPDDNAGNIDVSTVVLESVSALASPVELGDSNNNGVADLMVKFDRSSVHALLTQDGETSLTITGSLTDGTGFEGSDVVNVKNVGVEHTNEVNPGSIL